MKNNLFFFFVFLFCLFKLSLLDNPCVEATVKPYESNSIYIKKNVTKCVYFYFDNPSEGNIILKLARSNSYTSMIYIYEDKTEINYNAQTKEFEGYLQKYHIGEEFFKEKKIEGMKQQKYFFIIHEENYYFNDELIIYNDKFTQDNYYELNDVDSIKKKEFNFKYEYTNDNPVIIHFKISSNKIKYLNYQFVNINENGKISFYIYENSYESEAYLEKKEDKKEYSNYISLKENTDYYIKIVTDGEMNLLFDFLDTKIMKITPEDIFEKNIITLNDYYFYIEKELVYENDEYFNEFTIKLDSTNLKKLPFEVTTNTCDESSEEGLIRCIDGVDLIPNTIIKRDIEIPYIYHIYYSFNNQKYLVIKIMNKNPLDIKQRIIIEGSGGNDLVDSKSDKVFTDNKGYLYPVYLNVSITNINGDFNNNKNRIMFIYTNTTSAIKIFYNEDTFKNRNLDIKNDEYFSVENYVYGFDFNEENVQKLFGNRKYFTIMIYSPWESSPISFQLTFVNDNVQNFKYIIDERRPIKTPIKFNINNANEKYYFIGQYNEYSTNIMFNEVVYGKITAKYKFFNGNEKISRIIYNETANGYTYANWASLKSRIDIIEITSLSPALIYMHFIDNQAININDIIIEKGSQNYIFLNNTNYYNLVLSNELKETKNIYIEVFVVSQRNSQAIDIVINDRTFSLTNEEGNNLLRRNTEDKALENLGIQGKGTATTIRITIGTSPDDKNIAFYEEYRRFGERDKRSIKLEVTITNNNDENAKLCYTSNFVEEKYLYIPKDENCFILNKKDKTTLSIYNPWDKYLINKNKLYNDTDSYFVMVYIENENLKDKIEFNSEEELIEFESELKENEFINIKNTQNNIIKSSNLENQNILIQFSPIYNNKKLNTVKDIDDTFIIESQFDEVIKEGKIYNKNNRTYIIFPDPLIDTFIELDIQNNNEYEIKYNYFSNENNFNEERINDDYSIEFINDNNSPYFQFYPLLKGRSIDYTLYLSFDIDADLSSISSLKKLKNNGKTIYVFTKTDNSNIVTYTFDKEITEQLKNKKWKFNVLAEEKNVYKISMNYDAIEIDNDKGGEGGDENGKENEEKSKGSYAGIIVLCICIVIIIGGGAYAAYYFFYKKRLTKDEKLLKDINDVNLSMEDQAEKGINTEEGVIK